MADNPMPPINDRLKARFWPKVAVTAQNDCWNWIGAKDVAGYGRLGYWTEGKTIPILATHISLAIAGYPRPKKGLALHSCDNPSCVNPAHLRWGSYAENAEDMLQRGRGVTTNTHQATMRRVAARGERHCCAKISNQQVAEIIRDNRIHRLIAADYGISRAYVGELKSGKKRGHCHSP